MGKMDKLGLLIQDIKARIDKGNFEGLSKSEAFNLANAPVSLYTAIFDLAAQINSKIGNKVDKCGSFYSDISPCREDCAFCPFSHRHYASLNLENQEPESLVRNMIEYTDKISSLVLSYFKIVSTGLRADSDHIEKICEGISIVKARNPKLQI